jgi:aspartate racemase
MPDTSEQSLIMSFIYNDIKAGRQVDPAKFSKLISSFVDRGAQAVVLGCTELSLINRNGFEQVAFFDALEILAAASVQLCGARLTEKGKRILGI